jgi:hypothetical protein
MNLKKLRDLGFDESSHIPFTKNFSVKCSQCNALVLNGVPCHEIGCCNITHECKGCNTLIKFKGYCSDCSF